LFEAHAMHPVLGCIRRKGEGPRDPSQKKKKEGEAHVGASLKTKGRKEEGPCPSSVKKKKKEGGVKESLFFFFLGFSKSTKI
jgi:hypothetical protein